MPCAAATPCSSTIHAPTNPALTILFIDLSSDDSLTTQPTASMQRPAQAPLHRRDRVLLREERADGLAGLRDVEHTVEVPALALDHEQFGGHAVLLERVEH